MNDTIKRPLQFNSVDEIIQEVKALREGYTASGNWSLPQIAWHLNATLTYFMGPGPFPPAITPSPEVLQVLKLILATGRLPMPIQAPPRIVPCPSCNEADIDSYLASLERYKTFAGPYPPHPLFGPLSNEDARKLSLIHAAHHLSHLEPATADTH
ncbi:MAG: DUF1569 domain-containing protein [Planctomycetota bacterium]|nr:DUF1569 domain-containing protein [Planctomycetota bacterium]